MTLNFLYLNKAALKTIVFIFIFFSWFFWKFRVPENPKITYEKAQTGTWVKQGHDTLGDFFRFATFQEKFKYRQTLRVVQKNFRKLLKNFLQTGKYSLS